MARRNNPVVGTLHCNTCGEVATLHETARGKGKGILYRRCGCGCDQRTGEAIQRRWREQMTPREGFEHLKIDVEQPEQEPIQPNVDGVCNDMSASEQQPKNEPEQEPEQPSTGAACSDKSTTEQQPTTQPKQIKKVVPIGALAAIGAGVLLTIMGVRR